MLVVAVASVLVVREAAATEKPGHTCQGGYGCNTKGGDVNVNAGGGKADADANADVDINIDTGGADARADADADANATADANADADADATADASASNTGNTVTSSTHIDARTPGRSFVGGGDSTATDQKVFAISGGWLTGSAGIRLDWTDKEARVLRIADDLEADGLVLESDDMRCSLSRIYRNVGGTKDKCRARMVAGRALAQPQDAKSSEIDELRRMVQELSEKSRQAPPGVPGSDQGSTTGEGAQYSTNAVEHSYTEAECVEMAARKAEKGFDPTTFSSVCK